MNKRIGFIGAGNMAKAIIGGIINSKLIAAENIYIYGPHVEKLKVTQGQYGVQICNSAKELAEAMDILFISVKPNIFLKVLSELRECIQKDTIVISVAAGITISEIEDILHNEYKIVRAMPNTPALVGEGMSSICCNDRVTEDEILLVKDIFESFGKAEILPEYLIHSVIGASGSAPAYAFMMIEAMADGAVLGGMPRDKAYKFAAQALLGSAKMVLETGKHPGELKDMVCSPGGTTIEAVKALEESGFRAAVIDAMEKCMNKSKDMEKK